MTGCTFCKENKNNTVNIKVNFVDFPQISQDKKRNIVSHQAVQKHQQNREYFLLF